MPRLDRPGALGALSALLAGCTLIDGFDQDRARRPPTGDATSTSSASGGSGGEGGQAGGGAVGGGGGALEGGAEPGRWPDSRTVYCVDEADTVPACSSDLPTWGQDCCYQGIQSGYTVSDDHTVIVDEATGIAWSGWTVGPDDALVPQTFADYEAAWTHCEQSTAGGRSDWRLAGMLELLSLMDFGRPHPQTHVDVMAPIPANSLVSVSYFWFAFAPSNPAGGRWALCDVGGVFARSDWTIHPDYPPQVLCVADGRPLDLDPSDTTARDAATDLTWTREPTAVMPWVEAVAHCEGLVEAGYTDWRLPSIKELGSLLREDPVDTGIDPAVFPHTIEIELWSSTPRREVQPTDLVYMLFLYSKKGATHWASITPQPDVPPKEKSVICVRGGL